MNPAHRAKPRISPLAATALAAASLLLSPTARAADGAAVTAAQALFDEARRLTAANRYAEACPKFAESQRLDPSMGTEFYLADCLEHTGRLATAWTHYVSVADAARIAGQTDRELYARGRATALEPRLPKLTVQVSAEVRREKGLSVQRDGVALGQAQWEMPIPVDPGSHTVSVAAPGKRAWSTTIEAKEGLTTFVVVPALADAGALDRSAPPAAPADRPGSSQRTAGLILGAAGVVGLGVGAVLGVVAKSRYDASNEGGHCDAASFCDPAGRELREDAFQLATGSTVAFIAGGLALAGGAVLFLSAPSGRTPAAQGAAIGIGTRGVVVAGRW